VEFGGKVYHARISGGSICRWLKVQLKVEETMKRRALQASATAVPNHRRQFEGTLARYVIEKNKMVFL
jgi:hypothetical protein